MRGREGRGDFLTALCVHGLFLRGARNVCSRTGFCVGLIELINFLSICYTVTREKKRKS